jgi:hypothetical protein
MIVVRERGERRKSVYFTFVTARRRSEVTKQIQEGGGREKVEDR